MFRHVEATFILAAITICAPASSSNASAQSRQAPEPYVLVGVDCNDEEYVKSILDHAAISAGAGGSIIIIARFGTGENSRKLMRRRLFAPNSYLVARRGVSQSRVITAEGERVRGLGQVEIYVSGELFVTFKMKRNRDFASGGCPPVG